MKTTRILSVALLAAAIATMTLAATYGSLAPAAVAQQVHNQPAASIVPVTTDDDDDDDGRDDDDDRDGDDDDRTQSPSSSTASQSNTTTILANESSADRVFYVFNDEVEEDDDLDDDIDIYSLQTIVVNRGESVAIQFYNLDDDDGDRHSFTIDAPYNIDADLVGGENALVNFTADSEGIFQYYSKHDQPQMTGQLVVLSDSQSLTSTSNSTNQ